MTKTFIIAEAGINHGGNLETALNLCRTAKAVGVDAIKFQTFFNLPKFKQFELSKLDWEMIKYECEQVVNIEFMSTPDTIEAVNFLAEIGMSRWKIGSRAITNTPLLQAIAKASFYGFPENEKNYGRIYMSTGMATLDEICDAIKCMAEAAGESHFCGNCANNREITVYRKTILMHCVSKYPCPISMANLGAIKTMIEQFGNPIGYSDHTKHVSIPAIAVAMGATVIEKHFTLDKTQDGPDHAMSLEPKELAQMVRNIRDVEVAMGDGVKKPTEYELSVRDKLRNYEDCYE